MIRQFEDFDVPAAREIHEKNELPTQCMPELFVNGKKNPLFILNSVYEEAGSPAIMSFLKVTSEVYLLVDHTVGTPEQRWEWLKELKEYVAREAFLLGMDQITCYVPTDIEQSFAERLLEMGFAKSPWQSYTLNLE